MHTIRHTANTIHPPTNTITYLALHSGWLSTSTLVFSSVCLPDCTIASASSAKGIRPEVMVIMMIMMIMYYDVV